MSSMNMRLPMVQLKTTPLKLSMKTTPSELKIDQGDPITLDTHTEPSSFEMHTEHVKVEIDQTKCFEEVGLKGNSAMLEDTVSFSKQKVMEGISKTVDHGNQLAAIENPQDPIPDQATYNAFDQFIHEWNLGFIPQSRPEFKVIPGNVDINYKPAKFVNDTKPTKPNIQYTKSKVDIYVEQHNSIEMSVVDLMG